MRGEGTLAALLSAALPFAPSSLAGDGSVRLGLCTLGVLACEVGLAGRGRTCSAPPRPLTRAMPSEVPRDGAGEGAGLVGLLGVTVCTVAFLPPPVLPLAPLLHLVQQA